VPHHKQGLAAMQALRFSAPRTILRTIQLRGFATFEVIHNPCSLPAYTAIPRIPLGVLPIIPLPIAARHPRWLFS